MACDTDRDQPGPAKPSRRGLTLLEVLVASLVFMLALLPAINLMGSSQREVTKVSERLLAIHLAMSMVEEMRARPSAQRSPYGPVPADSLSHLTPLLTWQRTKVPASGPVIDGVLQNFRCTAILTAGAPPLAAAVRASVTWSEAGEPHTHTLEAQLDPP